MTTNPLPGHRLPFPARLNPLRALLPELLAILEGGREREWYAFVWLEETLVRGAVCARLESCSQETDRGVVFRIQAGGTHYEHATNRLIPAGLRAEARAFRARVEAAWAARPAPGAAAPYRPRPWPEELAHPLPCELRSQIPGTPAAGDWVHFSPRCLRDPRRTTLATLRRLAAQTRGRVLAEAARFRAEPGHAGYPELGEVRVAARQTLHTQLFADRERRLSQCLPVSLLYAMGVSAAGTSGRAILGGLGGLEIAALGEEGLREAAVVPLLLARAERLTPGHYTVITGPDVTGVIAHEAFGHTQEGDTWMKGRSIAEGLRRDGVRVGNDHASIINHPGVFSMDHKPFGTNGSLFFDHEGELARPQTLLDRGWLGAPMTDLAAAQALGVPRSANGKRESWRRPLMTRQTNTYFTPGDATLEQLIARVPRGFIARHAHGGMEDPKGGSLTAGTEYLEEIVDGRLTGRLFLGPAGGHIELSDPVFDLLARIGGKTATAHPDQVPDNKYGGCGKYHKESVDAGCGGPWILWESVTCG